MCKISSKIYTTFKYLLIHLFPMHPFSTPWQHQKNVRFSVFRGWRKGALGTNGLNHLVSLLPFYTPWKQQKTNRFFLFSGNQKWEHWPQMSYNNRKSKKLWEKNILLYILKHAAWKLHKRRKEIQNEYFIGSANWINQIKLKTAGKATVKQILIQQHWHNSGY